MSGSREDKREIRLLYLDSRIPVQQVEDLLEKAWKDIYDLEFDLSFGRFRGIHSEEDGVIHVTWENSYGAPFICSILPDQDHCRIDYCPQELYDKEESSINQKKEEKDAKI